MINSNILQIIIITYNRCDFLDYTLSKIVNSGFHDCPICVLDNCSTDNTESVCEKYAQSYSNITIIRHEKNIGASANYLRAVEIADCEYVWILCDDDVYDFEHVEDVCSALEAGSADLIFVGSWEKIQGEGGSFLSKEYYDKYSKYFSICLYVPSVIFRTEKFSSDLIRKGYLNARDMYPHFSFYLECYKGDAKIYISKKQILYCADDGIHGFSKLDLTISLLSLSEQIENRLLREKFIDEVVFHNEGPVILMGRVVVSKADYGHLLIYHRGASYFLRILFTILRFNFLTIRHRVFFGLSAIVSLAPRFLCKIVAKAASKKIKEKYSSDLPDEILKLKKERMLIRNPESKARDQLERMRDN